MITKHTISRRDRSWSFRFSSIYSGALGVTALALALLINSAPAAQPRIIIGGDLLVDLNIGRGLALDASPTPRCFGWTNYGTAGGYFHNLLNPPFLTARTNPFTYQVVGGSNALFTGGGQGMESSFSCPNQITG